MMNNDQEEWEKDLKGAPTPAEGLRRSGPGGLRNLPSLNAIGDGGNERKRARRQEVRGDTLKNPAGDGDDVNVSVQVNPKRTPPNLGNEASKEANSEIDKNSLVTIVPVKAETEGLIVRGRSSSSLPTIGDAVADGRSEIQSSEKSREAHPCLFIENILDVVFSHIIDQPRPTKDVTRNVQNIRQVCKTWNISITRLYRKILPAVTFEDYDQQEQGSHGRRKSLTYFMNKMGASQMIPVQSYIFRPGVFRHQTLELFREFLVLCGPEAVSLQMSICSSDAGRIMASLEKLADFQMMKLQTLRLRLQEEFHEQVPLEANQVHGNAKLVELLLAAARTLREFKLSYPPCAIPSYRIQQGIIIQQLTAAIVDGLPRTVKQLKLELDMNELGLKTLAGIQSQLEMFQLEVNSVLGDGALYQFLQRQATALKHFGINGNGEGIVEFPRMDELVHLDLSNLTVGIPAPFDFAETFPKLQCLKIPYMELETNFLALLSCVKKPCLSLEVLHLPTWSPTAPAPICKNVANFFPCLTKLHLSLFNVSKEMMGEVFTYFDNLEVLHIHFYLFNQLRSAHWVESMFSGISGPDCFRIRRLQDFDNEELDQLPRQPSILNLTKLRKLVIEIQDGRHWFSFTDFSAHFVFLQMDRLREIHLPNCLVKFSPMYMELLKDKLFLRDQSRIH